MNRIDNKLAKLEYAKKTGLVSFVMAGDPDLETSLEIVKTLIASGSSMIEIGMPFSDPVADGPTIQKSGIRALKNSVNLHDYLKLVSEIRKSDDDTPLILMGYFNPILQYGVKNFLRDAAKAGLDAMLIVDLPIEEAKRYLADFAEANISLIQLITPNSSKDRIAEISQCGSGFIYYVSANAITGTKTPVLSEIKTKLKEVREISNLKIAVGFGINNSSQVKALGECADLVVIGSAYIKLIAESANKDEIISNIQKFNQGI